MVPPTPPVLPPDVSQIASPLRLETWAHELHRHPDREYVQFLVDGMRNGFRIGYDYGTQSCKSCAGNMVSARQHPEQVRKYLATEIAEDRIIGPVDSSAIASRIQISRFGVIPKPHQSGKWRLITDLSSPEGSSVNDGIPSRLCSMSYTSVDDAVSMVLSIGRGAVLAKFDLESAYRLIPVHPTDRLLLGMKWGGSVYMDGALPFGLRSAPKLFTAVADALLWIIGSHGVREGIHYLDDFLILGRAGTEECSEGLERSLQLCKNLGVTVAPQKTEGPATTLSFLVICLDTDEMIIKLPQEKLTRLRSLITEWKGRRTCCKRDLLSLIGQLQHACKVVRAGRSFLRRMIDLSTVASKLHHRIRLSRGFQSDLHWWDTFLVRWNGVSMMRSLHRSTPVAIQTSDASGGWGCGAFTNGGEWFQVTWPESWSAIHITVKELVPIVVACAIWGQEWQGSSVRCRCDNAAVVAIVRSGSSKHPLAMHLLRCLSFFVAVFQLYLDTVHLPGRCNEAADALSRSNLPLFTQLTANARQMATPIPDVLLNGLIRMTPDWSSPQWTAALRSILVRD